MKYSTILSVIATIVVSVQGFQLKPVKTIRHQVKMTDNTGVTAPLGFFDPLGFSSNTEDSKVRRYRESEIKHGRVAMLATLGLLTQEIFHPLLKTDVIPPSIYHFQVFDNLHPEFKYFLLLGIGLVEYFNIQNGWKTDSPLELAKIRDDYVSGDVFRLNDLDEDLRNKELNNGRLAMLATLGIIAQELATKQPIFHT